MEILLFALGVILFCGLAWLGLRGIGRAMIAGEDLIDQAERKADLAAIQDNLYGCSLQTPSGTRYLGPSGRLYSKDDVFPLAPKDTRRRAELQAILDHPGVMNRIHQTPAGPVFISPKGERFTLPEVQEAESERKARRLPGRLYGPGANPERPRPVTRAR